MYLLKPCQMKRMKCKTRRKNLMMCHKNAKNFGHWNFLGWKWFKEKMGVYIMFIICVVVMCVKGTFFLHLNWISWKNMLGKLRFWKIYRILELSMVSGILTRNTYIWRMKKTNHSYDLANARWCDQWKGEKKTTNCHNLPYLTNGETNVWV